jgi:cytochrome P450
LASRRQPSPKSVSIARGVEEILRWSCPILHVLRTATRKHCIGDVVVAEGDTVTLWNISANRDEGAFSNAEAFDAGRHPNRHLSFGLGEHYCLGAPLARVELNVFLQEFFARYGPVVPVREPDRLRSNFFNGYSSMPVVLTSPLEPA